MSSTIASIATTRVSNMLVRQQLLSQIDSSQTQMDTLETEISSGQRIQVGSQDPAAASRIMSVQSLLEQKDQYKSNITATNAYLSETDSSLSSASTLLSSVQSEAVSVVGSTATDSERTAVVEEINQAIQELATIGNEQFDGRYLFSGSATNVEPFTVAADGTVTYNGNDGHVSTYADTNTPFTSNVTGDEAFGALSPAVEGAKLGTSITGTTQLASLLNGQFNTSGLQITNNGTTYTVSFAGATTVEDVLNRINSSGAGVVAQVNDSGTGINIASRISGADFSIGENGGDTAQQLGVRTFTADTQLSDLNHGAGIGINTSTTDGTAVDFTISQAVNAGQTVQFNVSLAGATTVGDVCQKIDDAAQAAGSTLTAQLSTSGNGIELVDNSPNAGPATITTNAASTAAVDLGLIPSGQTQAVSTTGSTASGSTIASANAGLTFTANGSGSFGNVWVVFQDQTGMTEGHETATYNGSNMIIFNICPQTDANDVMSALARSPTASGYFSATLATPNGSANDGTGLVAAQVARLTGGASPSITGADVNPQETTSVFTALVRLRDALQSNDGDAEQRAMTLLTNATQNLSNTQAVVGAREQSLSQISNQIDTEETSLKTVLSNDFDTDMASAISNFTAAQTAYQAALETTGAIFKLTLMNYL